MAIAPTLRCPCGERGLQVAAHYSEPPNGETRFDFGSQPYRREYRACGACGHWFAHHALDLSALYASAYVDATYGGVDGMRSRFDAVMVLPDDQSDNRRRVARIRDFARSRGVDEADGPALLDVGAGLGVFPAAMAQAGWRPTALEPDARTVRHLREVAGVEALSLELEALDPARHGRFDAITFNKVLEHVEDPLKLLMSARRVMREGGFVYVEVPDVAAAAVGPDREEFFVEHHHVFSAASLAMLAERGGFLVAAIERLREPSGKFTLRMFGVGG